MVGVTFKPTKYKRQMKKLLLALPLILISLSANAIQQAGYVGWPGSTAFSQDIYRYQCPAGTKSAVLQMNVVDLNPIDRSEVNSSMNKPGGMNSAVLRYQRPNSPDGTWIGQAYINYPYMLNSGNFNYVQIEKTEIAPGYLANAGYFYYTLLVQCKSAINGTGSALGVSVWTITQNSGQY